MDTEERAVFPYVELARAAHHTALCFPMQNEPGQPREHKLEPSTPLRCASPCRVGQSRRARGAPPPPALCFPMQSEPEPPTTLRCVSPYRVSQGRRARCGSQPPCAMLPHAE